MGIHAHFGKLGTALYVERRLLFVNSPDQIFGAPDTIISEEDPYLHVSNFTDKFVTIAKGQYLVPDETPGHGWIRKLASRETTVLEYRLMLN